MNLSKTNVPIQVGSDTYQLRYNFEAVELVENQTDNPLSHTLKQLLLNRITALRLLLFAGLKKNHPDITMAKVNSIIDDAEDLSALTKAVFDAVKNYYNRNQPDADAKKKDSSPTTTDESTGHD